MSPELHMAQLELDAAHLLGIARDRRWSRRRFDDLGYLVHQQLAALFGDLAPRPFRPQVQRGRWLPLLGYTSADAERLRHAAEEFAQPAELSACRLPALSTKPMPASLFQAGRRLGFEVRACPVVRLAAAVETSWCGKPQSFRAGTELDAYLHRRYLKDDDASRERVYLDWLGARIANAGAAVLVDARLHAFRRVRVLRQGRRQDGDREVTVSERPDALLTGALEVANPAAFRALLARGLGRHCAFGFGMLLLRPPSGT